MNEFVLFAEPWWVNLLIAIPFVAYFLWRKRGLAIPWRTLVISGLFGIAFGFVEASVVVYLRAAVGLLPGYAGTLADIAHLSSDVYLQAKILGELPQSLLTVELFREAATMIMLLCIALLAAAGVRERWAMFLWTFAVWDVVYLRRSLGDGPLAVVAHHARRALLDSRSVALAGVVPAPRERARAWRRASRTKGACALCVRPNPRGDPARGICGAVSLIRIEI